jgi:hypothetical protein
MTDTQQLAIFDETTSTPMKPRLNCTGRQDCPAEADEHRDDCPVEAELKRIYGF